MNSTADIIRSLSTAWSNTSFWNGLNEHNRNEILKVQELYCLHFGEADPPDTIRYVTTKSPFFHFFSTKTSEAAVSGSTIQYQANTYITKIKGSGQLKTHAEDIISEICAYQTSQKMDNNSAECMFLEEVKHWATYELALYSLNETNKKIIHKRIRYFESIMDQNDLFFSSVWKNRTIQQIISQVCARLKNNVIPEIKNKIAEDCAREQLSELKRDIKEALQHATYFLYHVFRDSGKPIIECATMPRLTQGKGQGLDTTSGFLLYHVLNSAALREAFPDDSLELKKRLEEDITMDQELIVENNMNTSSLYTKKGNLCMPIDLWCKMTSQKKNNVVVNENNADIDDDNVTGIKKRKKNTSRSTSPTRGGTLSSSSSSNTLVSLVGDINHGSRVLLTPKRLEMLFTTSMGVEKTGVASAFCNKRITAQEFVKAHAILQEFAKFIQIVIKAEKCAGGGGDLLLYGFANRQLNALLDLYKSLVNKARDQFEILLRLAEAVFQCYVEENKAEPERCTYIPHYRELHSIYHRFNKALSHTEKRCNAILNKANSLTLYERFQKLQNDTNEFISSSDSFALHLNSVLKIPYNPAISQKIMITGSGIPSVESLMSSNNASLSSISKATTASSTSYKLLPNSLKTSKNESSNGGNKDDNSVDVDKIFDTISFFSDKSSKFQEAPLKLLQLHQQRVKDIQEDDDDEYRSDNKKDEILKSSSSKRRSLSITKSKLAALSSSMHHYHSTMTNTSSTSNVVVGNNDTLTTNQFQFDYDKYYAHDVWLYQFTDQKKKYVEDIILLQLCKESNIVREAKRLKMQRSNQLLLSSSEYNNNNKLKGKNKLSIHISRRIIDINTVSIINHQLIHNITKQYNTRKHEQWITLSIRNCFKKDDNQQYVVSIILDYDTNPNLEYVRHLDLSTNPLTGGALQSIWTFMGDPRCNVSTLDLSYCTLCDFHVDALKNIILYSKKLKRFHLVGNSFSEGTLLAITNHINDIDKKLRLELMMTPQQSTTLNPNDFNSNNGKNNLSYYREGEDNEAYFRCPIRVISFEIPDDRLCYDPDVIQIIQREIYIRPDIIYKVNNKSILDMDQSSMLTIRSKNQILSNTKQIDILKEYYNNCEDRLRLYKAERKKVKQSMDDHYKKMIKTLDYFKYIITACQIYQRYYDMHYIPRDFLFNSLINRMYWMPYFIDLQISHADVVTYIQEAIDFCIIELVNEQNSPDVNITYYKLSENLRYWEPELPPTVERIMKNENLVVRIWNKVIHSEDLKKMGHCDVNTITAGLQKCGCITANESKFLQDILYIMKIRGYIYITDKDGIRLNDITITKCPIDYKMCPTIKNDLEV